MSFQVRYLKRLLIAKQLTKMFNKHIDFHVKSYRCKEFSCVTIFFSSATCMLRHKREIHDKHDHKKKSHLYTFVRCNHSVFENDFLRH